MIECRDWSRTGSSRGCFPGLQSVLFVGFCLRAGHVSIHCTILKKKGKASNDFNVAIE